MIIKRIFDLLASLILLIVLLPLFSILTLLIFILLGRPIFYRQERSGFKGKTFKIFKFRTMKNTFDEKGQLLSDEKRMTAFGKFLRSASLDELPELWNVFMGNMSLVGPRPLFLEYLPLYNSEQIKRLDMHPGITGWAQINGRNNISWEEKFTLDVWYVEHWSGWLDIKILLLTIPKVLRGESVAEKGHVTARKFLGTPNH